MPARSLFITFFFFLFILPGTTIFAQQKEDSLYIQKADTITIHTYQNDSSRAKQEDTAIIKNDTAIISENNTKKSPVEKKISRDSSIEKRFNPKKAVFRSAILPGWGQFYNKKYWKIPIVYGALGITAGVFFYNLKTYRLLRDAVIYRAAGTAADSARVAPEFQEYDTESLRLNRNVFRQNIDYSVLVFIGFWVLNIIDADVDANLKAFDVSPDISMKLRPAFNNTTGAPGISLVFFFKEKSNRPTMPLP